MIKIIKQGNPEQIMKRFKCPSCGCEWVASEYECEKIQSLEKRRIWRMCCPCCGRLTVSTDSI